MTLPSFLSALFEDGRVRVPGVGEISETEQAEADEVLLGFEAAFRRDLPGEAPPLFLPAARGR